MTKTETCPQCGGTGWRVVEHHGLSGAERCDCVHKNVARKAMEHANIPPLYANSALDNFMLPQGNDIAYRGLSYALTTVRSYAREFPGGDKPGLLLIGEPGTGKTHLAVAALRILISRGFDGLFFDYQNLLETIRAGFSESTASAMGVSRDTYRQVLDAEILLLDDLGAQRVTDWVEDTITSIITYRCNHRKPLIATTNLRDPDLTDARTGTASDIASKYWLHERIGSRARSRLFEMCKVLKMPAVEDYRIRRRQGG